MAGRPKLPYLVFDENSLNLKFYTQFDEWFLNRKVEILSTILEDPELLGRFSGEDQTEIERTKQSLGAEILFAQFHLFETFFAMLLAPFQDLPHWIFLSTYETGDIKEKARQFVAGQVNELSNGMFTSMADFLTYSIFDCYAPKIEEDELKTRIADMNTLGWLITRMAQRYLKGDEYNSYKHGLRIVASRFRLAASVGNAVPTNLIDATHSITHLKLGRGEDGTTVHVETKAFNPKEFQTYVNYMSILLSNMKSVRTAKLKGSTFVDVQTLNEIDIKAILNLETIGSWTFPA